METNDLVLVTLIGGIMAKVFYDKVYPDFLQMQQDWMNFLIALNTWKGYFLITIVILPAILFLTSRLTLYLSRRWQENKKYQEEIEFYQTQIEKLLEENLEDSSFSHIEESMSRLEGKLEIIKNYEELEEQFVKKLKNKLGESEIQLKKAKHEERARELREEKRTLARDIEQLKNEKEERAREAERDEENILKRLNIERNTVFKKDDLKDFEWKTLLKHSYQQTNQHCICEQNLVTVLVKKVMNHSLTHTFLVWNLVQFLRTTSGITDIRTHDTRDADIIFVYQGRLFALEVETGTLLEKPQQLREKVAYLNKKYGKRWMFIVSNKDLIWQYQKLGFSTQRNEVENNLQKLLENA